MKKYLSVLLSIVIIIGLLSGCSKSQPAKQVKGSENTEKDTSVAEADITATDSDMFTDRDSRTEQSGTAVTVTLEGDSATASSKSVQISGSTVTLTEDATYRISGTLDNGTVIVNAPETAKMQIILDGANINSNDSAALYIAKADKVFVTLETDSENTLSNGGKFKADGDTAIDAALFSKQDITFNGAGALTVTSPAGHGIVSKDDLVITGGSFDISSSSHGIDANDSVRITGDSNVTISAGKDGIHAENNDDATLGFVYLSGGKFGIEAEGDGISAGAYLQIEDGEFDITAGGGSENAELSQSGSYGEFKPGGGKGGMGGRPGGDMMRPENDMMRPENDMMTRPTAVTEFSTATESDSASMKGLKAANIIQISGGKFNIDSADDSIHSDISINIDGGSFEIASGDDALHAEKTLNVTDCDINITTSYEGLEALNIAVSGGNIELVARDDGLNAAGGTDSSGVTGGRDGMFGGGMMGGKGGMMGGASDGSIVISGGTLYINSSGDGLDANGTLEITGGKTTVTGPTQGDTATLDYDISGVINGGTFIGTGASNMAQSFSDSKQGVIALNVGNQSAGTEIVIKDADGKTLVSYAPELSYQVIIISTPELVKGNSYTVTVGTESGEFEAN